MTVINKLFDLPIDDQIGECIDVTDWRRKADLREALQRALNTWEDAPRWLRDLYDELIRPINDQAS